LFVSRDSFRQRLRFLVEHYRVIDLPEAVRQLQEGCLKPNQVVLTFDDGFYNFYSQAAPILKEFQVPATVYAVSDSLDDNRPNLGMMARDLILRSTQNSVESPIPGESQSYSLATSSERARLTKRVLDALKSLSPGEQELLIQKLATGLSVDLAPLIAGRIWHTINVDEMCELSADGFCIQLHTHSHLNVVDYAANLEEELQLNRSAIERVTCRDASHFCYPSGCWEQKSWDQLRKSGVVSATTTRQGPNFRKTPLLALRRVLNGENRSQLEFEFQMSNLRWLLWAMLHPRYFSAPTEQAKYKQASGAY